MDRNSIQAAALNSYAFVHRAAGRLAERLRLAELNGLSFRAGLRQRVRGNARSVGHPAVGFFADGSLILQR